MARARVVAGLLPGHGALHVRRDARHGGLELRERALALAVAARVLPPRHGALLAARPVAGRSRLLGVAESAVELRELPVEPRQVVRRDVARLQVRQRRLHRLAEAAAEALAERRAAVARGGEL